MFCAVLLIRSGSIGRFVPTLEHLGLGTLPLVLVLPLGVHHLEVTLGRLRTCIDKIIVCNDIGLLYWRSLGHQ